MIAPTIYLLVGEVCFQRDEIIAAYESNGAAEAEAARLNKLLAERPAYPLVGDSDVKWARYDRALARWEKKFPGTDAVDCDHFRVRSIGFIVAAPPAEDSPCAPPPGA